MIELVSSFFYSKRSLICSILYLCYCFAFEKVALEFDLIDLNVSLEERTYKWFEAAKSYEASLLSESLSTDESGKCWQRIGNCYDFASRQAKIVDEFREKRQLGAKAYEKAAEFFSQNISLESQGEKAECLANAQYLRSWDTSESIEKLKALDGCRVLAKEALETFKNANDEIRFGQTENLLLKCLFDRLYITEAKDAIEISHEALEHADNAIAFFSKMERKEDLCFAYSYASLAAWFIANISEKEDERKRAHAGRLYRF